MGVMEGWIVYTDGEVVRAPEFDAPIDDLKDLRAVIGKNTAGDQRPVDRVMVELVEDMWGEIWCDEEGRLTSRPTNEIATDIGLAAGTIDHVLVGTVVIRLHPGFSLRETWRVSRRK